MKTITIHPVTRIEGHARITLHLDEQGRVADSHFHVTQVRGFEKFTEGRPFYEMPSVMARICGICPVSHLLASSKACDAVMAVRVPPAGARLRSILHFGQFVQSHALSFFHLSSPDLLLGMDSDPARRNPGGVNAPLTADVRDRILREIPSARAITMKTLALLKRVVDQFTEEIEHFGNHPSLYLGLVDPRGNLELYDGRLRIMDDMGKFMTDQVDPETYQDLIGEAVLPTSYLKAPFYKPLGYPRGIYRVGPLARINLCDQCGTPAADAELAEFRQRFGRPARGAFHYHYARLIEVIFCLEKMEELLDNPNVLDPHVRAEAGVNAEEGIGVAEAPRGTLIHHYRVDPHGTIRWANLIIATGHNNLAINQAVLQVARHFVDGNKLREGMLNRVEAVVRCYDPCLSCSTHAIGQMPLRIQLVGADGQVLDEQHR
ncbi:MAG: NAD-reducing hydrogenase HoxS subunit beta [candidate division BRC1 bacterium ADurb.BinA292]|nr:MAG: NAD-reducing hydrogenase HoxS subunit beta [candidate division BRC1 bacterium ADurb.BinA292]